MTPAQRAIALTGPRGMSALTGIDRRLIQRIARGTVTPHQDTADKIAEGRAKWIRQRIERKVEG